MIPVIGGAGVAIVVVVVVWLIARLVVRLRRAHEQRVEARRLDKMRRSTGGRREAGPESGPGNAAVTWDSERVISEARREATAIVIEAEERAAEIGASAESERQTLLAVTREAAGRAAWEIKRDAKRTARAIIQEAEERAREIVAETASGRAQAERQLVRDRELAENIRRELATFLLDLLAEVQRTPGERPANVYTLGEAQHARSGRSGPAQ